MLPLQDFFTSVLPDPCRKWILLPALLNFPCPETSDRAEPRSEMQGQHSHLKDQMLQTARTKGSMTDTVRRISDVRKTSSETKEGDFGKQVKDGRAPFTPLLWPQTEWRRLRILKLSGEEFSSSTCGREEEDISNLLRDVKPFSGPAAVAAAMSWLRDSCGVQLAELQRFVLTVDLDHKPRKYSQFDKARLVKLWTDCVEAAVQVEGRASGLDLPSGSLRRKAATVAQIPRSPWESMGNGGGGISWGGRGLEISDSPICRADLQLLQSSMWLFWTIQAIVMERQRAPIRPPSFNDVDLGEACCKTPCVQQEHDQLGLLAVVFLLHAADGAMLPGIFKVIVCANVLTPQVSLGGIVFIEALCHSFAVLACEEHFTNVATAECPDCKRLRSQGLIGAVCPPLDRGSHRVSRKLLTGSEEDRKTLFSNSLLQMNTTQMGFPEELAAKEDAAGRAFGWLIACGQSGFMLGVPGRAAGWSNEPPEGTAKLATAIHGWRGTFLLFGLLTRGLFQESRTWAQLSAAKKQLIRYQAKHVETDPAVSIRQVIKISGRSRILQGAFASTTVKVSRNKHFSPNACQLTAMQYQIMWYQLLDERNDARLLYFAVLHSFEAPFGSIFGSIAAGFISDWMAKHYPRHGRITYGQLMDFVKTVVLLYTFDHKLGSFTGESDSLSGEGGKRERVTPDTPNIFVTRSVLSFFFGFFSIMAYSAVVKPLFAEIVPAQMVAQVIALAAAIDGGFASIAWFFQPYTLPAFLPHFVCPTPTDSWSCHT
ncbi:hypothetical protein AK812_SmicGene26936 [Symbiodinium microadriaticum]|uniref:Uncharacterized protein n=1 Tax=Symbiodinium microadriaticum TaxID=2951 RepID=A0A1Q9D8C0_SYMMI|nr:hypothetical protein AK812_SmicGene26936 [Symbiodinium microadriaticum]